MRIYKYVILTLAFCCMSAGGWCERLDRAQKFYILGEYDNAICELMSSSCAFNDEELYLLGMSYLKLGDYPQARDRFRRLIKRHSSSPLYWSAYVKLGDAFFLEGLYAKAEAVYEIIAKKDSDTAFKPLIYLRLAQIAAKEGRWDREKDFIRALKNEFPKSEERKYADMLAERGYFFTVQVGAFSQKDNAENLVDELKSQFQSYMTKEKAAGITLYKVRVGKYQTRREAERDHQLLVDKGYPARIYP